MAKKPKQVRSQNSLTGLERANRYIADVRSGKIPVCRWVRWAIERHVKDLKRKGFAYKFDADRANDPVEFIEALPHIKGKKFAGQRLILSDWQCFITCVVFGWINRKTGDRRFKVAYIEVPRKNGKSSWSAGIALYMVAADGEPGAEVYSAATARDQAKIVWNDAKKMVDKTPDIRSLLGVSTGAHAIYVDDTSSTFKPLSREQQGNLDGLNVHCAIIDELHAHKDRGIWDVIETATGARSQPLVWAITTAGFNRAGICYEQRAYVTKILEGLAQDDEYFGIIYTIDTGQKGKKDDDWMDPKSWVKANPNFGISVDPGDIERKARKASQMASAQNNFLTKHLNVWVNAATAWMDMRKWDKCADDTLDIDDFAGEEVTIALDLASKIDIAPKIRLFVRDLEREIMVKGAKVAQTQRHYFAFGHYYLPEAAIEEERNSQYAGWEKDGLITATPGDVIDFETIEEGVKDDAERFNVKSVACDPWQAMQLMQNLSRENLATLEYRQTVQNMSEPMKELEAAVLAGRFHHDGDPALAWMVSNVVAHLDAKDNIYPRKEFPQNKIDGAVALIMAIGVNLSVEPNQEIEDYTVESV